MSRTFFKERKIIILNSYVKTLLNAPLYNGRPVVDIEHINYCIAKVQTHRLALDIGGNVGFWSFVLADHFEFVQAFEPIPLTQLSFSKNITKGNVSLNKFALGSINGFAEMANIEIMCGASFITTVTDADETQDAMEGSGKFVVKRLDDLNFQNVDFIKIDTEGFEAFVVQGGMETILRCKPVIYMEQVWGGRYIGKETHDAARLLISAGANATPLGDGTNYLIEWP